MGTATRERRNGNGRATSYEEDSGWGSLFQRERESKKQPGFTGQLTLSLEDLREFAKLAKENGGTVELDTAAWVLPWKGKKRLRVHVQAPWEGDDDTDLEDDDEDGDDIPF